MTTKVHVVNFGPSTIIVTKRDPHSKQPLNANAPLGGAIDEILYPQQSKDVLVHRGQSLDISEKIEP